jgi:sugar phosphate isomerase/epimerase
MVFGSPKQRETTGGATRDEATRRYIDGLAAVAPHAAGRGVTILVEALPSDQCDVVLSLEEAVSIVNEINSPGVRTMFDTHNAVNETEPHAVLVDRYFEYIRHVHVNETDGGHCGTGDYDFGAVLRVLRDRNYQGWVSLEAFNFDPGPDRIAGESLRHLEKVISTL